MSIQDNIKQLFTDSIATKQAAQDVLAQPIAQAVELMVNALQQGHKIMSCGNGGNGPACRPLLSPLIPRH